MAKAVTAPTMRAKKTTTKRRPKTAAALNVPSSSFSSSSSVSSFSSREEETVLEQENRLNDLHHDTPNNKKEQQHTKVYNEWLFAAATTAAVLLFVIVAAVLVIPKTTTATTSETTTAMMAAADAIQYAYARFHRWFFKTRMSFYGDSELNLPVWFGACCWNYVVAGVTMLYTTPPWVVQPRGSSFGFPYRAFAIWLIVLQAPLSFLADYVHMTHDSYWHVADRCLALPSMIMEATKVGIIVSCGGAGGSLLHQLHHQTPRHLHYYSHSVTPILLVVCLLAAVACFQQSQASQAARDHQGFIVWHTLWHLYPLVASLIVAMDTYYMKKKLAEYQVKQQQAEAEEENISKGKCSGSGCSAESTTVFEILRQLTLLMEKENNHHHRHHHHHDDSWLGMVLGHHRQFPISFSYAMVLLIVSVATTNTTTATSLPVV